MQKLIYVIYAFTLMSFLMSCNQSQYSIDNVKSLIEKAEQNKESFSKNDFEKLEIKIEELQRDLDANRQNYTEVQIEEIGKIKGRYTALLIKKGFNDFKKSIEDLGSQMEGFIEGISDTTKNK